MVTNADAQAIQQAYDLTLAELYNTMLEAYVLAAGSAAQQAQADKAFQQGVLQARTVRDRAIALL